MTSECRRGRYNTIPTIIYFCKKLNLNYLLEPRLDKKKEIWKYSFGTTYYRFEFFHNSLCHVINIHLINQ
jgi:hypothetical protein